MRKYIVESQKRNGEWLTRKKIYDNKDIAIQVARELEITKGIRARVILCAEPAPPYTSTVVNGRILCRICGVKGDNHRGYDGMCPQISSYGNFIPDPSSDYSLEGNELDKAIDEYWNQSTFYQART